MIGRAAGNAVKYTAILPKDCMDELRSMTEKKLIPSVNQGIRTAVEEFVHAQKQQEYERRIKEAASDDAFLARTMESQQAFEAVDAEADGSW